MPGYAVSPIVNLHPPNQPELPANPLHTILPETSGETKRTDVEKDQCVVCLEWERVITFIPCGHLSVCFACMTDMAERDPRHIIKCPTCKKDVTSAVRTYRN